MPQPTIPVLNYNFQSELGSSFGTHLDDNFQKLVSSITESINRVSLIQRDDGWVRNGVIGANAFTSDALALMAGSSVSSSVEWLPRGEWVTATLYKVGNIVETGSPAVAYVCSTQHTSGTFATDYAADKWVVLSSPRTLTSADVTTALTFTPVNKAGDTMTGALVMPTGSKIGGASGMTFTDTLLAAQDLITINKGLYSVYTSAKADHIYGFAANVVRSSGTSTQFVVGSQCSAFGEVGALGALFGANPNAIGLTGFTGILIGQETDVLNANPGNTAVKRGMDVVFKNRGDGQTSPGAYSYVFPQGTYSSTGAGLGSNAYNAFSVGIHIDSQQRTSVGEYCGWSKGIEFEEYALDYNIQSAVTIPALGIDFSVLHYYGGSDPTVAYRMDAAIALRDLQAIWWNRDPASPTSANKVRTYFDVFSTRWVIALGGIERFGVDVNTGDLYKNGVIATTPSLTGANNWTGANSFTVGVTLDDSNLIFIGNGNKITADFSTATLADRLLFQTIVANSATEVGVVPNGSATACGLYGCSDRLLLAGVVGRLGIDSSGVQLSSTTVGGGAAMPLDFAVGPSVFQRINASGQVMLNTTTAPAAVVKLRVNGAVQFDQPVAFSAHRNGVNFNLADNTLTVVDFTTEEFDTNSSFDLTTDRFTPPAGKYQLSGAARTNAAGIDQGVFVTMIYKNGAQYKSGNFSPMSGATTSCGSHVSCIVDANGTDYFQLVVYQTSGAPATLAVNGLASDCWFQGIKVA